MRKETCTLKHHILSQIVLRFTNTCTNVIATVVNTAFHPRCPLCWNSRNEALWDAVCKRSIYCSYKNTVNDKWGNHYLMQSEHLSKIQSWKPSQFNGTSVFNIKINWEDWSWSICLRQPNRTLSEGRWSIPQLNQAFIYCLVKHKTTLFSDFHKKTSCDWWTGRGHFHRRNKYACAPNKREQQQLQTQFSSVTRQGGRESCQLHLGRLWRPTVSGCQLKFEAFKKNV